MCMKAQMSFGVQTNGDILPKRRRQPVMEWLEYGGRTWDETVVKVYQPQKLAQIALGVGLGELLDQLDWMAEIGCPGGRDSREVAPRTVLQER